MTGTTLPDVIILAGGKATRWRATTGGQHRDFDKLDAPINGRPLLWRTIDMLAARGITPRFCGAPQSIHAACPDLCFASASPDVCGAVAATSGSWGAGTAILLGDVVWSNGALDIVLSAIGKPWRFLGKAGANAWTGKAWGEIYALTVSAADAGRITQAAGAVHAAGARSPKLWDLYDALRGRMPLDQPLAVREVDQQFTEIADWTDDIDTPHDYAAVLRAMKTAALGS